MNGTDEWRHEKASVIGPDNKWVAECSTYTNAESIASAHNENASLREQLAKERALRKELVEGLHLAWTYVNEGGDMLMDTDAKKAHAEFRAASKEIQTLLRKSKLLDDKEVK